MKKIFKPVIALAMVGILASCASAPTFKQLKQEYQDHHDEYYTYSTAKSDHEYEGTLNDYNQEKLPHGQATYNYVSAIKALAELEDLVALPFSDAYTALSVKEEKEVVEGLDKSQTLGTYEIGVSKSKEGYYVHTRFIYSGYYDLVYNSTLNICTAASEDDLKDESKTIVHLGYAILETTTYDVKGLLVKEESHEAYSTAGDYVISFTFDTSCTYTYNA